MTSSATRIAITGASGRLGSALVAAAGRDPGLHALPWDLPDHDLDVPDSADRLVERDRPGIVVHTAAWTDVDGCARDPGRAMRRNADAVGAMARACARAGVGLMQISTNEVFDGERDDGRGYTEDDPTGPRNPYGASKLAGEEAARTVFAGDGGLWIVRTAWLYGPPGADFPAKIVAAADRQPPGEPLPVVEDEIGSPTFTFDLATACLALLGATSGGTYHLVNGGTVSRLEWAEHVLARLRPGRAVRPISRQAFVRASDPPAWGVLDPSRAAAIGVTLRDWHDALDDYLGALPDA